MVLIEVDRTVPGAFPAVGPEIRGLHGPIPTEISPRVSHEFAISNAGS